MSEQISIERTYLRLVLTMAASFQGGHCKTGDEIADMLCIPFPLTMKNLSKAAQVRGFDPDELWPWLARMRRRRAEMEATNTDEGRAALAAATRSET